MHSGISSLEMEACSSSIAARERRRRQGASTGDGREEKGLEMRSVRVKRVDPPSVLPVVQSSMFLIRNKDFCTLPALPEKGERMRVETLIEFLNEGRSQNEKRDPLVFIYLTALCLSGIFSTSLRSADPHIASQQLQAPHSVLSFILILAPQSCANCIGFWCALTPSTQSRV